MIPHACTDPSSGIDLEREMRYEQAFDDAVYDLAPDFDSLPRYRQAKVETDAVEKLLAESREHALAYDWPVP